MARENCIIVRASGRELDELRSEAYRIAKSKKIDWWVDRSEKGTCFCFEDGEAKQAFVSVCVSRGIQHIDR